MTAAHCAKLRPSIIGCYALKSNDRWNPLIEPQSCMTGRPETKNDLPIRDRIGKPLNTFQHFHRALTPHSQYIS
jgi:hypothetical protein